MDEQYEAGLTMRKQVLGEAQVIRAAAEANDFTRVLQYFVTRNAWGTVWQRDGLELKTRSLVTLGMLVAVGGPKEIGHHVRGAISNGATEREIQEVLLHASVYCGFPRAIAAYEAASASLSALKEASPEK